MWKGGRTWNLEFNLKSDSFEQFGSNWITIFNQKSFIHIKMEGSVLGRKCVSKCARKEVRKEERKEGSA